ncbi:MAG TPA: S41 family peptidase [bacterium]|nr:S41 family peptidase [bacterium]
MTKQGSWGRWLKFFIVIIIISAALGGGFLLGVVYSQRVEIVRRLTDEQTVFLGKVSGTYQKDSQGRLANDLDFSLFWQTWDLLKADYVDHGQLSDKQLFYSALSGLVNAAKDPYTVFMNPEEAKMFNDDLAGSFTGIGAEVGLRNDIITIIAPLSGMPAEKAGLRAGDKVYAINKESTAGLSVDEAVKKIRGEKGTEVTLTIARGNDKVRDIKIVRDTIVIKSVKSSYDEKTGFYRIEINNFNSDTNELFRQAVEDIKVKQPRGIILDLRNNPGGYLDSAIAISSYWIQDGVVVSEQFSNDVHQKQMSRGIASLADIPTVVLINQGSASASEIVAGALMDHEKAVVVGKTTYGKGSVQIVRDLPDGSLVKITAAKWLTPKGTSINEKGIAPNIEVDLTEDDFNKNIDPQLQKAEQLLKDKTR